MSTNTPRPGDHTNEARDKGYYVAHDNTLRDPHGQTVQGWHGPLRDNRGTLTDRKSS